MPGGLLTMMVGLLVALYTIVKTKNLVLHEDWSLQRQVVLMSSTDLNRTFHLGEERRSNISIAVQFSRKRHLIKKSEQNDQAGHSPGPGGRLLQEMSATPRTKVNFLSFQEYEETVKDASTYLTLYGMVELKNE